MRLQAVIRPKAEANLYAAAAWYQEEEPRSSLWLDLIDEFEIVVAQLCEYPESAPVYEGRIRRAFLRRFPYAIYYLIESEQIVILRFLAMKLEQGSGTW